MEFSDYELNFSKPRMQRYLVAANSNRKKAAQLYLLNIELAKAFYPMIGAFEVALRNRICEVLAAHFNDKNWIMTQRQGFMAISPGNQNGRSRAGEGFLLREIEKAEQKIRRRNARPTSDSILAEQSMGFWLEMYEEHCYRLLVGKPIQAFGKLPPKHGRREICQKLHLIRILRNRISHNEPIIFEGMRFDLSQVKLLHATLLELAEWLNPQLHKWMKMLDQIERLTCSEEVA
jgi:Abi-like protein